ncbi:acyl-CoA dehydratase activase-related protein [Bacillota bacterium]
MRIGVPEALLFYRYEPFARAFFDNLKTDVVYSGASDRSVLDEGIKTCVDEACLPIKMFQGHVSKLMKECDKVVVPRIMKCEFGESICPKFAGLPDMLRRGGRDDRLIFTEPLYLNDSGRLKSSLLKQGKKIGIPKENILNAIASAGMLLSNKGALWGGGKEEGAEPEAKEAIGGPRPVRLIILGHPYNIHDSFINMNLIRKLEGLGATVIEGGSRYLYRNNIKPELMKKPYWMFFRENLCNALFYVNSGAVDGIVYVSSFCCGTDSVTIEMIKSRIKAFPMLVLKYDEHTGEAGIDTRIEAFMELIERRMVKGAGYEVGFSENR